MCLFSQSKKYRLDQAYFTYQQRFYNFYSTSVLTRPLFTTGCGCDRSKNEMARSNSTNAWGASEEYLPLAATVPRMTYKLIGELVLNFK